MKQLFILIAKGLNASIDKIDNYGITLSCVLYDGITPVTLRIDYDKGTYKVSVLHVFVGRAFGNKGSKPFIFASDSKRLCDQIANLIKRPEQYILKIKGRTKAKNNNIIQAVTVKIGKRNYHTGLYKNELHKFNVVNPAELGTIGTVSKNGKRYQTKYQPNNIRVRGTANKKARSGMYQAMLRPKTWR